MRSWNCCLDGGGEEPMRKDSRRREERERERGHLQYRLLALSPQIRIKIAVHNISPFELLQVQNKTL